MQKKILTKNEIEKAKKNPTWESMKGEIVEWEALPEHVQQAMLSSTDILHEERRRESSGLSETDWWIDKKEWLYSCLKKHPKFYYVADCENCEWSCGGWISQKKADKVLRSHVKSTH